MTYIVEANCREWKCRDHLYNEVRKLLELPVGDYDFDVICSERTKSFEEFVKGDIHLDFDRLDDSDIFDREGNVINLDDVRKYSGQKQLSDIVCDFYPIDMYELESKHAYDDMGDWIKLPHLGNYNDVEKVIEETEITNKYERKVLSAIKGIFNKYSSIGECLLGEGANKIPEYILWAGGDGANQLKHILITDKYFYYISYITS